MNESHAAEATGAVPHTHRSESPDSETTLRSADPDPDDTFSRLRRPFAVRPDPELDETEAQNVAICRKLSMLAAVMILAFWMVYRITDPGYVDPLWGRILFALLPGGLALSSYVISAVRRHFIAAWRFFLYAAVVWFSGLTVLNAFDPSYALGTLFIVAATSAGFSVGLRRRGPLLWFLGCTIVLPTGALLAVPSPGIGRLLFAVSLVSLAIIFYLILDWRIRAENALRESREQAQAASRLKSTIIGNLHHEFRTPLTSILGFAESLKEELPAPERHQAQLIYRSGTRLQRTLDTLLAFSRLRAGRVRLESERIDVVQHVTEAVEPFEQAARRQGLDLTVDAPASGVEAHLHPDAVERIATVLVDNAVKFTDEGHVAVRVTARNGQVLLSVADTGIGMDEEARRRLFEPFRQASEGVDRTEEGLGLGLSLVGQLVELMEGTIEVESEPGTGTRFEVKLPRAQNQSELQEESQ